MRAIKRIIPVILIILLLCGCSAGELSDIEIDLNKITDVVSQASVEYTEENSVVEFAVYPDGCDYLGKFERSAYLSLNEYEKHIYLILDDAVYNMTEGEILLGNYTYNEIDKAYSALRNDRPEYFWLPSSYSLKTVGKRSYICFSENGNGWRYSKEQRAENEKKIKQTVTAFFNSVGKGLSEYERELTAHNFVADITSYDKDAKYDNDAYKNAWNICGVFIDKKAVCSGYSKAFQLLLFSLSVNNVTVSGVAGEPHMWNCVEIDNEWYHCDVTSDDTEDDSYKSFFNVTTEAVKSGRSIYPAFSEASNEQISAGEYNVIVPLCFSTDYNYFRVNSLYAENAEQVYRTVVSSVCAAVGSGGHSAEIFLSPKTGFVFGKTDIIDFVNLTECLKEVNSELSGRKRIKEYSVSGINGAHSFMLSWN